MGLRSPGWTLSGSLVVRLGHPFGFLRFCLALPHSRSQLPHLHDLELPFQLRVWRGPSAVSWFREERHLVSPD